MTGQQIAMLAAIASSNGRIAAMIAANKEREIQGLAPAYDEDAFMREVATLEYIEREARNT